MSSLYIYALLFEPQRPYEKSTQAPANNNEVIISLINILSGMLYSGWLAGSIYMSTRDFT